MLLNKNLFKSVVVRQGYTQESLAAAVEMSQNTMSSRVTGKSCFNTDEIDKICDILRITDNDEKAAIFLSSPSQNWEIEDSRSK